MKTNFVFIIFILCIFSLNAHEEFYKRNPNNNCERIPWIGNDGDILRWPNYSNIPICGDWSWDWPLNDNLILAIVQQHFINALNRWDDLTGENLFDIQQNFGQNVQCRFINSTQIFPNSAGLYAHTWHMWVGESNDLVAYSSTALCGDNNAIIGFNSTTNKFFTWRTDYYIPSAQYMDFEWCAAHEIGHLLGLGHCSTPGTLMVEFPPFGDFVTSEPQADDITGFNIIRDNTVGIEDYLWVWDTYPTGGPFNINEPSFGRIQSNFIDNLPYGDYLVELHNWRVKARSTCGEVLVYESSGGGSYNAYIDIPPLPPGKNWIRDGNGNVLAKAIHSGVDNTGYYHEGYTEIKIAGVPNTFVTSGPILFNTEWCGDITITGTILIPPGITLTINPGANITFTNNASLMVHGKLKATGCTLSGGSGSWGTIQFFGASSSQSFLKYVILRKATEIQCLNDANVIIENSYFDYCNSGIYIYNAAPQIIGNTIIDTYGNGIHGEANGKSPLIKNNTIKKLTRNLHNYQGIYLQNFTNPFITGNNIQGYLHGIYYAGGGSGVFTDINNYTPVRNNRLSGNKNGFTVAWGSYLIAGINYIPQDRAPTYMAHKNSIWGNTNSDAYAYQSGTIIAKQNWWGTDGAQVVTATNGYVDASSPLSADPWSGIPLRQTNEDIYSDLPLEGDPVNFRDILDGIELESQGNITSAVNHYKKMLNRLSHPKFAVGRLAGIKKRFSINNIQNYLETLLSSNIPYKPAVLNLVAGMYLDDNRYEEAIQLYNLIITGYPNSYDATNALFEKFFAAFHIAEDLTLASQLLSELQSLNSTDEDFLMRLEIAEEMLNGTSSNRILKGGSSESENNESNIPGEYSLLGNFPNPFNPSTTISFALPYQSSIELVIYDIMGAKVKSFVVPSQAAGFQNILWDGKNENGNLVASGIYLYRINMKSLENNEMYIKTAKLIMLK